MWLFLVAVLFDHFLALACCRWYNAQYSSTIGSSWLLLTITMVICGYVCFKVLKLLLLVVVPTLVVAWFCFHNCCCLSITIGYLYEVI